MKHHKLLTTETNEILYEGLFETETACLEKAIEENINLINVNLRHKNLSNANLDKAIMPYADFTGANLTGANLSESLLDGASFHSASLYNACLCESNIDNADFQGADFGATDIFDTSLKRASFSTLSCFTLNFSDARSILGSIFYNPDGTLSHMSHPPIVIKGLSRQPLIILDREIRTGYKVLGDKTRLLNLARKLPARIFKQRLMKADNNSILVNNN